MTRLFRFLSALAVLVLLRSPDRAMATERTTDTGVMIESLGTVIIPREALPKGDVTVSFVDETIPAGVSFDLPSGAPTRAADATVQLAGTVRVTWGSPIHVDHPDGTVEEIPADTPVTFHAGDRFMVADAMSARAITVVGTTTVEWLDLYLADGVYPDDPFWTTHRPPAEYHARLIGKLAPYDWFVSGLGAHDLSVTFQRTTLAPSAIIALTSVDQLVLRTVEAGRLTWAFSRTGVNPVSAHPVLCEAGTVIPWLTLRTGERITLANQEAEPVVLVEAILRSIPDTDE
jgi:hypothetical protein